ncbi:hypothetical protein RIF29_38088 [Crotalaria pallida]|uniref:Uncharacterized protein n=1 Tax=Crotalaria pallida TaxID=3830 RepID=A0AAN9E423_CROPI
MSPLGYKKHVKKVWVEKKKPSRDDIEKIDDALRTNDEEAVNQAVADANKGGSEPTSSNDTVVAETVICDSSSAGVDTPFFAKNKEGTSQDPGSAQPWIPVKTRSKNRHEQNQGKSTIQGQASKANG